MRYRQLVFFFAIFMAIVQFSCSNNDVDPEPEIEEMVDEPEDSGEENNSAPKIDEQDFEISEEADALTVIGTVTASDDENDSLAFSLTGGDDGQFVLNENGQLSLAEGATLNFQTKAEYQLNVTVSDGTSESATTITVRILEVESEGPINGGPIDSSAFVTVWRTTEANESILIPADSFYEYDYTVEWGDGQRDENITNTITHSYAAPGTYTVVISGIYPAISFGGIEALDLGEQNRQLIELQQWGTTAWKDLTFAFAECPLLTYTATDVPDFSEGPNLYQMFSGAASFNGAIGNWDMSEINSLNGMFAGADAFNQDISGWDVRKVIDMSFLFNGANSFNQDLDDWETDSLGFLEATFAGAISFNGEIGSWNVTGVTNMDFMFQDAVSFDRPLNEWNVENVTTMKFMFNDAESFNQPLADWDVSGVNTMQSMFRGATVFDQDLGSWQITNLFSQNLSLANVLDRSGLSVENYDKTLIGWSELDNLLSDVEVGAFGLEYCEGEAARNKLITESNWDFSGDSRSDSCP